ncbi:MAG: hypothetical protein Q9195_004316 [Heterodermia aff. obscurata]
MAYLRSFKSHIVEGPIKPGSFEVLCRSPEADGSTIKAPLIPESRFEEIAKLLEADVQKKEWSSRPRTYFILWQIKRIDAMEAFIGQGLNDTSIPYKSRQSLPSALDVGEAFQFLQWQDKVVSDTLHLEQGKHVQISDGDVLFESQRRRLGVGSQGTTVVDKVVSKATGKVYARKRIHRRKMFGYDTNAQKVYENELETLKKVADHEHLIKVRATYTDKKHLVMLLQPVADENLKEYMTRKPLDESDSSVEERARLRTYFGCLAHTIQILHDSEILHKDIKPENILLKSGHVILTDFGTAFDWSKTGQSMTQSNAKDFRTPRYQSPEAALGMFHRSSDIWSLGVVFLEMVTFLQGRTIADMDAFLCSHGHGVTSIHDNIEGAMNWFEELQASNTGSAIDNEPLTWIKGMLNRVHSNRPTAADLFEDVVTFQDGRFCGHCCLDTESSSDEDFESDRDLLSDIEEGKEPEVSVSGDHQRRADTALEDEKQSISRIISAEKVAYTRVVADATPLVNMPLKCQTGSQGIADDAASTAGTHLRITSGDYQPDQTPTSSVSPLLIIPQTRSKVGKVAKEWSSLNHQKTSVKPKTKTFRERDTFIQWLASLPEKFAPNQSQHRSNPSERLVNPGRCGPSVETQRIKHFLSSLPEEITEFDDALESFDDFNGGTTPFKSFNRSRTISIVPNNVRRSNSQEDLQSSSHILQEENDEHQPADVGRLRLVHYASDGDLNQTVPVSKEILEITKKEFREFSKRCRLPDLKQSVERKLADSLESQRSDHKMDDKTRDVEVTHLQEPLTLPAPYGNKSSAAPTVIGIEPSNNKASTINFIHARMDDIAGDVLQVPKQQKKQASQKPSKGGDLTKGGVSLEASTANRPPPQLLASAQGDNASKASTATKTPPRLRAFVRKAPARRRMKFESATDLMERILDDKSSEAPTSVMSAGTRATVLGGLIGLRWNDKSYGYLPKFVANGKVGAVRECLKAGCNPGREEKPRWAPVYNAVSGCSNKHLKCLRELVFYGADVNARRSTNGRTPLHYAVESKPWSGYSSVIYTLLAAGADPNIRDGANDLPVLMLLNGNGPLPQEKRDALFLLLAPNFATDLKVRIAGTRDNPLHLAIRRKDAYTVDAILEKMKQIGDSASYLMHEHNGSGFTPILLALNIFELGEESDEELQIIEYLLRHGANTNDGDLTQGKTPLHLIIGSSKNSIVLELLCRHLANPKLPDISGQTAEALAAKLRASYPKDLWYQFAARRITNKLTTKQYRPPELEAFLAEEAEIQRAPLST